MNLPNRLTVTRLVMAPLFFLIFFLVDLFPGFSPAVYAVLLGLFYIVMELTDLLDGKIARKKGLVTDLGKVLDPVADKFTEGILMILIALRYPLLWMDVVIFAVGAFLMSFWGLRAIERQHFVNQAHWYGKATTVFLYLTIFLLLVIDPMPKTVANILIVLAGLIVIGNVTAYGLFYRKLRRERAEA